jgi:hypothetical protein
VKNEKKDIAAQLSGIIEHTFSVPVNFESEIYEKIEIDLNKLTGRDMSIAKSDWAKGGNFSHSPSVDPVFCNIVACKAAGMPSEFADYWPGKDYMKIGQEVSNFLLL